MDKVYPNSTYKVPSFARKEVYNFDATKDDFAVYQELNAIAKEIEECRQRNV